MRRESIPNQYAELFHRHSDNPILTARDWPYPAHTVFNAGACQLPVLARAAKTSICNPMPY